MTYYWKNTKFGTLLYLNNKYQGISINKTSENKFFVCCDEGYKFYKDFQPIECETFLQAKNYANNEILYVIN